MHLFCVKHFTYWIQLRIIHKCNTLLLIIPQSFAWLAAFHLDLLQAILFIAVKLSAPVFLATCFKYCSRGRPTTFFFSDIVSSGMFTTNSLCITVCPIHEWRLFLKFLKVIFLLSTFEKFHHSLFCLPILFLTIFSSTMFQMRLWPSLHFFLGSTFLIRKEQHSKYNSL